MSARDSFEVVVLRNNGEERLLLTQSADNLPALELVPFKASFLTPAPARNALIRQHAKASQRRFSGDSITGFGSFR